MVDENERLHEQLETQEKEFDEIMRSLKEAYKSQVDQLNFQIDSLQSRNVLANKENEQLEAQLKQMSRQLSDFKLLYKRREEAKIIYANLEKQSTQARDQLHEEANNHFRDRSSFYRVKKLMEEDGASKRAMSEVGQLNKISENQGEGIEINLNTNKAAQMSSENKEGPKQWSPRSPIKPFEMRQPTLFDELKDIRSPDFLIQQKVDDSFISRMNGLSELDLSRTVNPVPYFESHSARIRPSIDSEFSQICKLLATVRPLFSNGTASETDERFIHDFSKMALRFQIKIDKIELPPRLLTEVTSNDSLLTKAHQLLTSDLFAKPTGDNLHLEQLKTIVRAHVHQVVLNSQLFQTTYDLIKLALKLKNSNEKTEQKYRINA